MAPASALTLTIVAAALFTVVLSATVRGPQITGFPLVNVTSGATPEEVEDRLSYLEWFLSIVGGFFGNVPPDEPEPPLVKPEKCELCTCGMINKRTRIVGGHVTHVNQYPWIAKLFYRDRFYCAGSLINSRYVITASHCLHGFDYRLITVRLLEHDATTDKESKHIDIKVRRVLKHSRYNEMNFNNDIALIRLDHDVEFGGLLRPVCLPPRGRNFTGDEGIVAGWGTTRQGGSVSDILLEVAVPILSNADCRRTGYGKRRITDNMMCAGVPEGKRDSCQGDSGGPLHVVNDTVHQLAGIVSWGDGCARPNYPGVYARVNRYLTWINQHTVDSCYCSPQSFL